MIGSLKKVWSVIVTYYFSILNVVISVWLAYTLLTVGHPFLASILFVIIAIKITGLIIGNGNWRTAGIVGLNACWVLFAFYFASNRHVEVALTYHFPFFIFLLGLGVAIRGRFNG